MKSTLIKGVPVSMQQDGWWLNPPPPSKSGSSGPVPRRDLPWQILALIALIALGDRLFWDVIPGLSVAVFGIAVLAVAVLLWPRRVPQKRAMRAAGIAVVAVLPVMEDVQALSLAFFLGGLPIALSVFAQRRPFGAVRYWWAGPFYSVWTALSAVLRPRPNVDVAKPAQKAALQWGLPAGVGLIFMALLVQANPVFEHWALAIPSLDVTLPHPGRLFFWMGLGMLVWPAVTLVRFAPTLSPDHRQRRQGPVRLPRYVNAGSVLRSLVLFNLMFALQNIMDVAVLSGGASLPEGMTYAEYAHRGAYPLVGLALLSGGFALLARPLITGAPWLKWLLLVWVGQTVFLTLSSVLRLDLYVDAYGLTRLRIAAAIWMGLVATGLGLILVQIAQARTNYWMLTRISAIGAGALYLCCFFSFDRAIGQFNLSQDVPIDSWYLCDLSEAVVPPILEHTGQSVAAFCGSKYHLPRVHQPEDWREWGFRNARVRTSVAKIEQRQSAP